MSNAWQEQSTEDKAKGCALDGCLQSAGCALISALTPCLLLVLPIWFLS